MGTILQWNCRGLMNNHPELCLLSQQYNPVATCLQETHIADISNVSFKGYTPYHRLDHSHDRASGGSSILIRNDVIHSPVNLNTNLQAVAVKITISFVFTICSIYAPPNKYIDIKDLEHLLSQMQQPVMLLGDFNSHNPLWGSEHLTPKGRVLETFDQKLTFIPHMKALKTRCLKALDIIKVVSNQDWGADKSVLLNLYRSLIRSKLDYGCIVYGSARSSYLKMLNTIHHQGLRLALGAFRTSPIESLYVEAGELPLEQRRIKLSLQYITKLKATPSNPAYYCVFHPEYEQKYTRNTKSIAPLGIRMKEHLENSNILLHQIYDNDDYIIPPWELSSPIIDLTLHSSSKKETTDSVCKQRFLEIKDSYENKGFTPIYTDGSKSDKYVSASVVPSVDIYKVNLPDHSTIFTAEAVALKLAVQHIQRQVIPKSVIFSDSLSCLQALQGKNLNHPVICEILEILTYLSKVNTEVVFCWIPGHVGIKGNEKADKNCKTNY